MAPLFRPANGPEAAPPAGAAPPSSCFTDDATRPLSEGAKLKYTVANPAIAASSAAMKMVAGDASRSRFSLLFTSSSLTSLLTQGSTLVTNTMWGGRFLASPAAIMEEINASIDFDKRLWRHDILASKAHAAMLAANGIISQERGEEIAAASTRSPPRSRRANSTSAGRSRTSTSTSSRGSPS